VMRMMGAFCLGRATVVMPASTGDFVACCYEGRRLAQDPGARHPRANVALPQVSRFRFRKTKTMNALTQ